MVAAKNLLFSFVHEISIILWVREKIDYFKIQLKT